MTQPKDPRSTDQEIVKFCRDEQLRTLSIWDIQRVHCVYVKEKPFQVGATPYFEVYLVSGELIKLSNHELAAAYSEFPEYYRLDEARKVLSILSAFDRLIREGVGLGRAAWQYSDWIEKRYKVKI